VKIFQTEGVETSGTARDRVRARGQGGQDNLEKKSDYS